MAEDLIEDEPPIPSVDPTLEVEVDLCVENGNGGAKPGAPEDKYPAT